MYIGLPVFSGEVDDWEIRSLPSDAGEEHIEDSSGDDGSEMWWPNPEESLDPEEERDHSDWVPTVLELN